MAKAMQGRVAVVTGAQRGVGLAIAQEFIAAGATVVITDIDRSGLDDAVAALGSQATGMVADVTNQDDMTNLYRAVVEQHGRLDAIVANAGVGDSSPIGSITEKQFDFIFGVTPRARPLHGPGGAALPRCWGHGCVIGSTASLALLSTGGAAGMTRQPMSSAECSLAASEKF